MADHQPPFKKGLELTFTASADVVGGTLAEISGAWTVATAAAASTKYAGTFAHSAKSGEKVLVHTPWTNVDRAPASGAITAGAAVQCAAAGAVAAGSTAPIGKALTTVDATAGQFIEYAS